MTMSKAPFGGVYNPDSIDLPKDWNSPVAPGATQKNLTIALTISLINLITRSQMNFCRSV